MRSKNLFLSLIIGLGGFSLMNAQSQQDVDAIKSMSGCYEVSFNFSETFSPNKDYVKKKNYHSEGLEWVTVAEEEPGKIVLQHILVVDPEAEGKEAIVKHWRQDWIYENTDLYVFEKDNHWIYKSLSLEEVKGQWTQIVYQVDDAPRYSASGTWVHVDGRHYWESNADAPLPRREYSTRSDYNVLNRTNRQEIFDWGWQHTQDNKKVLREDDKADQIIAEEIGKVYYRRVEEGDCSLAEKFWEEYAPLWKVVRDTWNERMQQKKDLYVKPKARDVYLYKRLMKLEPQETQKAEEFVKEYIVE